MPKYDYKCPRCVHTAEYTDPNCKYYTCPMCLAIENVTVQMKRIYNAPGIVFKGPGFYKTDSREQA